MGSIVQSEYFGSFISKEIQKRIINDDLLKLSFSTIKVSLLPPSTELRGVELELYNLEDKEVVIQAERLGAGFSFWSFLSSEINISELFIENGDIHIKSKTDLVPSESTEKVEVQSFVYETLPTLIESIHNSLPIKIDGLSLVDIGFIYNELNLEIETLDLELFDNFLVGDLSITQLAGLTSLIDFPNPLTDIDSLKFSFEHSKYDLNIRNLEFWRKLEKLSVSGQVSFEKRLFSLKSQATLSLENYSKIIEENIDEWMNGYISVETDFSGNGLKINAGELQAQFRDFSSNFILIDTGKLEIGVKDNIVTLNALELQRGSGTAKLTSPTNLFDLSKKENLLTNAQLYLEGLSTNAALYIIRNDFERVKGLLNGTVDMRFSENFRDITFKTDTSFRVENFSLKDDDGSEIIGNPFVNLRATTLDLIDLKRVSLNSEILFGEKSRIKAKGNIGDGLIDIQTSDTFVDMKEFGPIAGLEIGGAGEWDLEISGPLDDIVFDVDARINQFSIINLYLNQASAKLKFNLNKLNINLEEFQGSFGQDSVSANGVFDFSSKDLFDLNLIVNDFKYSDLQSAFSPIYNLLPLHPAGLGAYLSTTARVWGTFKTGKINTRAKLTANSIVHPFETFERLETAILYENEKLELKDFFLVKGVGGLKGSLAYDINSKFVEYDAVWIDTPLRQFTVYNMFNLGLDGTLTADLYGSGQLEDLSTRTQVNIKNSKVESTPVTDSSVTIYNTKSDLFITGELMGAVDLDAFINLNSKETTKPSYVNIEIQSDDLRLPLSFISKHNIYDEKLIGEIDLSFKSQFTIDNIDKLNATLDFNKFELSKDDLVISLDSKKSIKAVNGIITPVRVPFSGTAESFFLIDVEGELNNRLGFSGSFGLPVVYLDLLTENVKFNSGVVSGNFSSKGKLGKLDSQSFIKGERISLQVKQLNSPIDNLNFEIQTVNEELQLRSLNSNFGKGTLLAGGKIMLNLPYPSLDLDLSLDNSYISFLKRSGVVVSSEAKISGNAPPYPLRGQVNILYGEILEELTDFQAAQTDSMSSLDRYLPSRDTLRPSLLLLDLDLNIQRPVAVKNNLLELAMEGNAKVRGTIENPQVEGRFNAVPASSRFKFKGNDFNLTRGLILVDRSFQREGATLDFSGVSLINDYRIRLDVSGKTKNIVVGLSSEPGLAQEDIFSLLALGVTSDVSQELEETERQSVATVGIGTLLADQFKLNQGLDSSFGVKLSVLPEYAEEESNLLQGKSAVSDAGSSKFKSATRIRLQKKLNERVDLSVSSTVGGSLDQRQEMNVNYRINNKWSLEGVYELRSNDNEGIETTDSVGADLKYRWAF